MARAAGNADKRRLMLDAAIRVFARQGFHSARVSDIANEAGVAYGLVYHYFESKDEVLDTVFLERWNVLLEAIDAPIFALPSAFTLATTRDHWDVLVRARAIEQQAFFVAANQTGEHPGGMRSGGRSMIVDPWGVVLAQAPDKETHITADLDRETLRGVRRQLPALEHRRSMRTEAHA